VDDELDDEGLSPVPIRKKLGPTVIKADHVSKYYQIEGRADHVRAL